MSRDNGADGTHHNDTFDRASDDVAEMPRDALINAWEPARWSCTTSGVLIHN